MSSKPDSNEERMARKELLERIEKQQQELRRTVEESAEARRVREVQRQKPQRRKTGD